MVSSLREQDCAEGKNSHRRGGAHRPAPPPTARRTAPAAPGPAIGITVLYPYLRESLHSTATKLGVDTPMRSLRNPWRTPE
ncbi:hypothetical protein ACIRYZ_12490 [Kitasatospora sp. NPDC101155]|uniref:hypothetical protein n=1 Tax=Kitasatospora sp. NPDC101155 TaxID=3364097 RepID=UPI0038241EE6